jgi:hypothetical protein
VTVNWKVMHQDSEWIPFPIVVISPALGGWMDRRLFSDCVLVYLLQRSFSVWCYDDFRRTWLNWRGRGHGLFESECNIRLKGLSKTTSLWLVCSRSRFCRIQVRIVTA